MRVRIGGAVLALLFPPRCLVCRTRISATPRFETVCDTCFEAVPREPWCVCATCGARCPSPLRAVCHPSYGVPLIAGARFHDPAAQKLVHALKYRGIAKAALPLAALLAERVMSFTSRLPPSPIPLIPVPLHPSRERERGFNQSLLIARELARLAPGKFVLRPELLRRTAAVAPQIRQSSKTERRENVRGCFTALDTGEPCVALLDDVCTTGATLSEAARTLRRAGTRIVIGLAAARA